MLIFTSGTTGPSKGVLCTYLQIHTTARVQYGYMNEDDRILIDLPMFHIGGVGSITGTLVAGCSGVLCESFSTERFWERVHRFGATTTSGLIGSMPAFLSKLPPRDGRRGQSVAVRGHAADAPGNGPRAATRVSLLLGLQHDASCRCRSSPTVDTPVPGSCGRPRTGCECRIVDANDIECPPGVPGELIVRNDLPWTTSLGYVNQPEANARAWRNGWFHTGDLLYRDESGDFFFVDRLKDAIRRRGENISSVEVEAEVYAFPGVGEVAAVGVPSEDGEEEVLVAVVRCARQRADRRRRAGAVPRATHAALHGAALRARHGRRCRRRRPTRSARSRSASRASRADCWDRVATASRCAGRGSVELTPRRAERPRRYFCTFWFISK